MQKEEVPPEYLWEDSQGLEMWWAAVTERREQEYGHSPSARDDSDSGPELVENDLARAFKNR